MFSPSYLSDGSAPFNKVVHKYNLVSCSGIPAE
jgi:hypothetical protein